MKTPEQMLADLEETGQRAYRDFGMPATRVTCMEAKDVINSLLLQNQVLREALEAVLLEKDYCTIL